MPEIKYPRVEVSVQDHKRLVKEAKRQNTTLKALVRKALVKYFGHL